MRNTRNLISQQAKRALPAAVALTSAIAAISVMGCGKKANNVPDLDIVAIDRSGSTKRLRANQKALLGAVFQDARLRGDEFALWAVDRKAVPLMEPQRLMPDASLPQPVQSEIGTPPGKRSVGTRPAVFWEAMADRYSRTAGDRHRLVSIIFLTDGGNDWVGEEKRAAAAIKRLGSNPHVVVAVLGIAPDTAKDIEAEFAGFDVNRFLLRTAGQEAGANEDIAKLRR